MNSKLSQRQSILKSFLLILIFLTVISCSVTQDEQPRVLNQGQDLTVWIDGKQSIAIDPQTAAPLSIFSQSTISEFWKVDEVISTTPQIRYQIKQEHIGPIQEAMLTIQKIFDNPKTLPVPYYSNLSRPNNQFQPGYNVRIKDLQNPEEDRYLEGLPTGKYIFSLFVYGETGWDKQNIIVSVR